MHLNQELFNYLGDLPPLLALNKIHEAKVILQLGKFLEFNAMCFEPRTDHPFASGRSVLALGIHFRTIGLQRLAKDAERFTENESHAIIALRRIIDDARRLERSVSHVS